MSNIVAYMEQQAVQDNIKSVVREKTAQFIASVASLVNASEALKAAEPKSVLLACLTAASLDLPINQNLGFAYVIPYKNHKTGETVAQFQMGYKGFIQLAQRSGQFKTINVTDVREGEITGDNKLSGEIEFAFKLEQEREKLPITGYVAYMRLLNGFEKMLYMSADELRKHGVKYSKSYKKGEGLWKDEFDTMAKKTVIKLLLARYAPMTTDMAKAQTFDQSVIGDEPQYLDNGNQTAAEVAHDKEHKRIADFIGAADTPERLAIVADLVDEYDLREAYDTKLKDLTDNTNQTK